VLADISFIVLLYIAARGSSGVSAAMKPTVVENVAAAGIARMYAT
jgi:hypothetical protein